MYLIKGYNIHSRKTTMIIDVVRFSGFSSIICDTEKTMNSYRLELEEKESSNRKTDVFVVFYLHELPAQSKHGKLIREYLDGKTQAEIATALRLTEDEVDELLRLYIYSTKI